MMGTNLSDHVSVPTNLLLSYEVNVNGHTSEQRNCFFELLSNLGERAIIDLNAVPLRVMVRSMCETHTSLLSPVFIRPGNRLNATLTATCDRPALAVHMQVLKAEVGGAGCFFWVLQAALVSAAPI